MINDWSSICGTTPVSFDLELTNSSNKSIASQPLTFNFLKCSYHLIFLVTTSIVNKMDFECVQDERKSEIWRFFLLNKTEKLAKCNICHLTLKIIGGRTSIMWQHLKHHHLTAYQSLRQPTRVKKVAKTKEQMVSKLVSKIKKFWSFILWYDGKREYVRL